MNTIHFSKIIKTILGIAFASVFSLLGCALVINSKNNSLGGCVFGNDIDLPPLFPRWNQGFLGLFGYEYNAEEQTLDEYNKECKKKSIKNIHWSGKVYDPRGINYFVCSKLVVKEGEVTEIRIRSSNSEFRYLRTVAAWVPGIFVLAPLIYGSSMRTFDYSLEVLHKKAGDL